MRVLVVAWLLTGVLAASECPARCNCVKYIGKIMDNLGFLGTLYRKSSTKCVSCKTEFKRDYWGYDNCKNECADVGKIKLGNCNGCTFDGLCIECKEGFYGKDKDKCQFECPPNCWDTHKGIVTCNVAGYCQGCRPGYYNAQNHCEDTCSSTCGGPHGICDSVDGTCAECKPGWHGDKCKYRCNGYGKGCKECDKESGDCLRCDADYWKRGDECIKCAPGCLHSRCNQDGMCALGCIEKRHGFPGTCSEECDCGGGECHSKDGTCSCQPGRFGDSCKGVCPTGCVDPTRCDEDTGECDCRPGLWGLTCPKTFGNQLHKAPCHGECDNKCSPHCLDGLCDRDTGACECKKGYYGELCDMTCPLNCVGACDQGSGACLPLEGLGCNTGWYGSMCMFHCKDGCRDNMCHRETGDCKCKQGLWGFKEENMDQCSKPCSNCKNPLSTSLAHASIGKIRSVCKKETGKCRECPEDHWGPKCEHECAVKCQGGKCERDSGLCTCQHGYYGNGQCKKCPENCDEVDKGWYGSCTEEGECLAGCSRGRWGKTCDEPCSDNCEDDVCGQDAGVCNGCKPGWWGPQCMEKDGTGGRCPKNTIEDGTCEQLTGWSHGCKPGWWGKTCEERCPELCHTGTCQQLPGDDAPNGYCHRCKDDLTYGPDCTETAGLDGCAGGKCDMEGVCAGCKGFDKKSGKKGMFGDHCDQECAGNCDGGCNEKTGACFKCKPGFQGKSTGCKGVCHHRCGTCAGPSKEHCLSCPDAAEVRKETEGESYGKCKCVKDALRWEKEDRMFLGNVLRKNDMCYCALANEEGRPAAFVQTPSRRYECQPYCPRGMTLLQDVCLPLAVCVQYKRGLEQGHCLEGQLLVPFTDKVYYDEGYSCVPPDFALFMYKKFQLLEPKTCTQDDCTSCPAPKEGYVRLDSACVEEQVLNWCDPDYRAPAKQHILEI